MHCSSLSAITIPDSVTSIEKDAFAYCTSLTKVTFGDGITYLGWGVFNQCTALTNLTIPDSVTNTGSNLFVGCTGLTSVTIGKGITSVASMMFYKCSRLSTVIIPGSVTQIEASVFEDCSKLANIIFCGTPEQWNSLLYNRDDEVVPQKAKIQFHQYENGICAICRYCNAGTWIYRLSDTEELAKEATVYINGLPYEVKKDGDGRYLEVPQAEELLLVTYSYHKGDGQDIHTQYPTGMKVYLVKNGKITHIPELDNLLQYSGSSIRITGKKGIRMITSLTKQNKTALTGQGLAGFKLVEYGTALGFASEIPEGDALVLGRSYTRSNYAYKRGVADPVFASTKDLVQYTNVLVGFSLDQCKDDIAMRPYIILKDANGKQFTLYGGTICRSIGYIAYQNRNVFQPKTVSYKYVWEIIHYVYGNKYDADYKG